MSSIKKVFSRKYTENGDEAFSTTGNNLVDILFFSEYFTKNPDEVVIGNSEKEKLFAKFIRDPRYGLGKKKLGQTLLRLTDASFDDIAKCGRYDDLWKMFDCNSEKFVEAAKYLYGRITEGDQLAKKWMPRFGAKDRVIASKLANVYGINKQKYGKLVKVDTTEKLMTDHLESRIEFEHVPSLAHIKYAKAFSTKEHTKKRYAEYLEAVKSGQKELKVTVTTPYDIYRNANKIEPDIFFDKLPKIEMSILPIVDTSGSMINKYDSFGKALALGHYFSKCSTFMPNYVVSFSSTPKLLQLGVDKANHRGYSYFPSQNTKYGKEIASMFTGDCSNTDLGRVMELLKEVGKEEMPQYLLILSDMEFDEGSSLQKNELERLWRENGYTTKIIWWNLTDGRAKTAPELDDMGNIFMSGYNPMLLKFLEAHFDASTFLDKLLDEYQKKIG